MHRIPKILEGQYLHIIFPSNVFTTEIMHSDYNAICKNTPYVTVSSELRLHQDSLEID
jgi:hypothetical protein